MAVWIKEATYGDKKTFAGKISSRSKSLAKANLLQREKAYP